jgi:hypothetical protein
VFTAPRRRTHPDVTSMTTAVGTVPMCADVPAGGSSPHRRAPSATRLEVTAHHSRRSLHCDVITWI